MTTASQTKLANKYHTTSLPDRDICFDGKHKVVGIDLDETEMPKGRFIWFSLENPRNKGSVLRGTTMCDYRVKDAQTIRTEAIKQAKRLVGSEDEATRQVDDVIKAGGMLL